MKINKYPDGTSYISTQEIDKTNSLISITKNTFKINNYKDLWHLNQLVDACNDRGIYPEITIPNLIDAQADRRFNRGESSGLKLVCKFLNSMKVSKFKIFHPHNSEVVEAILNNVEIIDNSSFIDDVISEIVKDNRSNDDWYLKDNLILMSSDAGGFKPLTKLCEKINWRGETFSASKGRSWDEKDGTKFVQQIDKQDFKGKDILIIDDISVYGGTFKGLSKLLKERNCGKLYLAVSHITVQNLGEDPVTNYFDRVFTTNSKFDRYFRKTGEDCNSNLHYAEEIYEENLEIIKLF